MEVFYISLILVLTFVMRIIPRIGLKYGFGGDTFFHLYMGDVIRMNNHRLPERIPGVVLDHEYTYPYFYHWLLSFFSKENSLKIERITGALLDTLNTAIVYLFTSWVMKKFNLGVPNYFPLFTALLFSLSPAFLTVAAGPRAYCGSPRILGQTLYLAHILGFIVFIVSGNYVLFGLSVIAAAFLFFSSKFGVQVLIFFGLFLTIFVSPMYLLSISMSFLLSLIITRGRVLKVLEGHYRHSEYYIKLLWALEDEVGFRKDWKDFKVYGSRVKNSFKKLISGKVLDFFKWLFGERFFIHFTLVAFPTIVFLFFVFSNYEIDNAVVKFLFIWTGSSIFWFVITSVGYLRFLGEGERYLEFSVFGSIYLAVLYALQNGMEDLLFFYTGYCVILYLVHLFIFRERFKKQSDSYLLNDAFFDKVNQLEKGVIVPIGNEWQLLYRSSHPLLTYGSNVDKRKIPIKEFNNLFVNAHMPSKNVGDFIIKYKARYMLTTSQSLDQYVNNVYGDREEFQSITEKLLENNNFVVLKFKDNKDVNFKV